MKILVTGANGFIGKNLCSKLIRDEENEIIKFNRGDDFEPIKSHAGEIEAVFHLAGSNRPKDESEFHAVNEQFTQNLINVLTSSGFNGIFVFASSIQSTLLNPYGVSKRNAENILIEAQKNSKFALRIFRLTNVFGKWSKPDYNSVVATFISRTIHGQPLEIRDASKMLTLVYIDSVIEAMVSLLDGHNNPTVYHDVSPTFEISVGDLAELIVGIHDARTNLFIPDLSSNFTKSLFATYTSFLEDEQRMISLSPKNDNRGTLVECFKSGSFGQIFFSHTSPGVTRGNHFHDSKTESFLVVSGQASIKIRDIHSKTIREYVVDGNDFRIISISPGCTHSITNIGAENLVTIFWSGEVFDARKPDTHYLEVGEVETQ